MDNVLIINKIYMDISKEERDFAIKVFSGLTINPADPASVLACTLVLSWLKKLKEVQISDQTNS